MPDCFGNPTPGIPPSISDTFHDIKRYASIPIEQRMAYHRARTDLMIGSGDAAKTWGMFRRMNLMLLQKDREDA